MNSVNKFCLFWFFLSLGLTIEQIAKEEVLEETGYDIPVRLDFWLIRNNQSIIYWLINNWLYSYFSFLFSSLQFVCSSRSSVGLQASLHAIYFAEVTWDFFLFLSLSLSLIKPKWLSCLALIGSNYKNLFTLSILPFPVIHNKKHSEVE